MATTTASTADEDENMIVNEQEDNQQTTETKKPKLNPFSDLTDNQLMAIFGEGPHFRFELCRVRLIYDKIPEYLQLHGTIQAAVAGFSPDPLLQNVYFDVFNRKFSNPVIVNLAGYQNLHDISHCSLPVFSTSAIQIAARLYVTTDKVDDVEHYTDDKNEVQNDTTDNVTTVCNLTVAQEKFLADLDKYFISTCAVETSGEKQDVCNDNEATDNELWDNEATDNEELENEELENEELDNDELENDELEKEELENEGLDYGAFDNEAFLVCDKHAIINMSEKPQGGSGSCELTGKNGSIELRYATLKYAVDADLEVNFFPTSKESKITGRVVAYYGKGFDYHLPARDFCSTVLFEGTSSAPVQVGPMDLMRSVLAVPVKSSLIIEANLFEYPSGHEIFSGICEFHVPLDFRSSFDSIVSNGSSLNMKVNWKPPSEKLKIPSSNLSVSRLTERRKFGAPSTSTMADPDGANRWSLQEEIEKVFTTSLERTFNLREAGSCSISTCDKEDGGDYLCSSVLHIWPELRKNRKYRGPKLAGLALKDNIKGSEYKDMMEKCVVCGPGFVKFKLSGNWIDKRIFTMLMNGIDTWAPKPSVKKAIIYFLSRNITDEMHIGHLRSTFIGEALARLLKYSGVDVLRKRIHDGDHLDTNHLDIKLKMMTELLIERFPSGEIDGQAIGELEVLYKESKERFDGDVVFRARAQLAQGWDDRHQIAAVQICKIIREHVYQRLGVNVKEEGKSSYDLCISQTRDIFRGKGLTTVSEGDEAVFIEGRKLSLVDLTALWHALNEEKADWLVHVTDVGQQDYIDMCITAAKRAGWIGNDHSKYPLSHVGFGHVQGDDFERFRTFSTKVDQLVNLLDEAKSRCKEDLLGQGKANGWTAEQLEHTAEALGYGAVKYADLKNNRLSDYRFSFEQMFDEEGNTAVYLQYTHAQICSDIRNSSKDVKALSAEELILKNDDERELGLHLLRFTEVLGEVCTSLAPHILCDYLYGLCKKFNGLNSSAGQVAGSSEESSKLLLCEATEVVVRKCFDLLGITPICKI